MRDMDEPEDSVQTSSNEDHDNLDQAVEEGSISAGELGEAAETDTPTGDASKAEVIIGEIPDEHDLTKMLWTARCTFPEHGLLGTFDEREDAEKVKLEHLGSEHGKAEAEIL
jgi:hypothetical protein